MKHRLTVTALIAAVLSFIVTSDSFAEPEKYDVVVYGGTSAAVTTAVQVKKMGKSVVIVSPDKHLGGLSSGGLGYTDSGNTGVVGGLSREFYQRVYAVYQNDKTWKWQKIDEYANEGQGTKAMIHEDKTMWIFEPSVAEGVFDAWVKEMEIPVIRDAWLDREKGVKKTGTKITSMTTLCGKTFEAPVFIDATYEGDLMAAAGVEYHVGREANSVPGDPSSGRVKYVDDSKPGVRGEADHRLQAYCFRMCLTDHEPNRVPFPKPEGYDPKDYELLRRVFQSGWRETFEKFDRIPNHKTDTNNHGPFSTDFIGMNYDYPDASYARRAEIIEQHRRYQQGWFYFIANDPGVPEEVRTKMAKWGLAKDEFPDNGHWPHQLYIREARRMIGEYVTTELDCMAKRRCPKPVGMGSYTLDSHNVRRYVTDEGYVQNEGDIGVHPKGPYSIDYGSLTPKAGQCTNLLVPVCVSSSHIAFGSIRMEPVFMILGQSAGTAAVMAIDASIDVQKVDYDELRARLVADGQRLEYVKQNRVGQNGVDAKKLDGTVVDSEDAKIVGHWSESSTRGKYVGADYIHDGNQGKGEKSVNFDVKLPKAGKYEVRISYAADANRATNVPIRVKTVGGDKTIQLNQKQKPAFDDLFTALGEFEFGDSTTVIISNEGTDGHVIVDAVQFLAK